MGKKTKKKSSKHSNDNKKRNLTPLKSVKSSKHKQILLFLAAAGSLFLFFNIPYYHNWLTNRIFRYYQQIPYQMQINNIDERMAMKLGSDYTIPRFLHQQAPDSAFILLPPTTYAKKNFSENSYRWCYTIWNYYFSGSANYMTFQPQKEQDFSRVTHAVYCKDRKVGLVAVNSSQALTTILAHYQEK